MTAPRQRIAASLADRGRPVMWANEQEAAVLSGYTPERFRDELPALEKAGFPQKNRWNGLRFIPAILNFWACQVDFGTSPQPELADEDQDGPGVENFGYGNGTQRRSA